MKILFAPFVVDAVIRKGFAFFRARSICARVPPMV